MRKFIALLVTVILVLCSKPVATQSTMAYNEFTTISRSEDDSTIKVLPPIDNGDGSQSLGGISWALAYYYSHLDEDDVDVLALEYSKYETPKLTAENISEPVGYFNTCLSEEDYEILCRIVEAEATDGTIENKRNVTSCILTRVNSSDWPNTVKGVVFQKDQFTPIKDGRYYTVTITESTREAVWLTLEEGLLNDCTFFCSRTGKAYAEYLKGTNWWYRELYEVEEVGDSIHAFFKERRK